MRKREEVKKMRSLVQVFEDQGMKISPLIYRNYKYGTLEWKVWNTYMESMDTCISLSIFGNSPNSFFVYV